MSFATVIDNNIGKYKMQVFFLFFLTFFKTTWKSSILTIFDCDESHVLMLLVSPQSIFFLLFSFSSSSLTFLFSNKKCS